MYIYIIYVYIYNLWQTYQNVHFNEGFGLQKVRLFVRAHKMH